MSPRDTGGGEHFLAGLQIREEGIQTELQKENWWAENAYLSKYRIINLSLQTTKKSTYFCNFLELKLWNNKCLSSIETDP